MWHNEFVRQFGGEGNPSQEAFKTGTAQDEGGIPPQPSPPTKKTDLEKLAQIWATLCACERTFNTLHKEWTEYDGVPIKFWLEDAKECFTL